MFKLFGFPMVSAHKKGLINLWLFNMYFFANTLLKGKIFKKKCNNFIVI